MNFPSSFSAVRWIALPALLAATSAAQTASAPVLGWTLAQDGQSIQRISGVPGAARTDPPVRLPDDLSNVRLNPTQSVALALAGDRRIPVLVNLDAPEQRTALADAVANPDDAAWSPSGSSLALLYRDARRIQVYGFEAGVLQFKSELAAAADRVAVSDDGVAMLAATSAGLSLYQGGDAAVLSGSPVSSFTFLAQTAIPAYWIDGQLRLGGQTLDLPLNDGESLFLASPVQGRLVAVRSASGAIMTFDAAGQLLSQTAGPERCECAVSGLEAVGRSGAVRLATVGSGPLWVADSSSAPRLFFIPVQQQ